MKCKLHPEAEAVVACTWCGSPACASCRSLNSSGKAFCSTACLEKAASSPRTPRLYRSRKDRKLAGVCGGLGAYLDVDPVIFRVLLLVSCFFGGVGFLAYLIAWMVVPLEPAV